MRNEFILLLFLCKNILSTPVRVKYNDILIRGKDAYITEIFQESDLLNVHPRKLEDSEYINKDNIIIKLIANPQFLTPKPKFKAVNGEERSDRNTPIEIDTQLFLREPEEFTAVDRKDESINQPIKRSVKEKRDLMSDVFKAFTGLGYDNYYKSYMKQMYPHSYQNINHRADWGNNGYDAGNNYYNNNNYYPNRRTQPKIIYGWIDKKDFNVAAEGGVDPDGIPWA